jgi:hypothetical protein
MKALKDCKRMSDVLFTMHSRCDDLIQLSSLIQASEDSDADEIIILKVID